MRIRVWLFAAFREAVGRSELSFEAPDGATVREVVASLRADYPSLDRTVGQALVAANQEYVTVDHRLRDGDELALIPPVSGGAAR
jgi:molybdopterin synthase catalytic subunit